LIKTNGANKLTPKASVYSMEKRQTEIKNLKIGGFVLIDDIPCVVEKVQKSKSGKHGAAKARLFARGIFDNIKKIIVKPGSATMDVPIIDKKTAQVISLSGDHAQLMDLTTYETFDVTVPEELRGQLTEGDEVLVWAFDKYIMIKGKR
jgi:translation initiation factor 5A